MKKILYYVSDHGKGHATRSIAIIQEMLKHNIEVNVRNTKHGKHASVRLAEGYDAEDAAMRLGAF